MEAHELIVGAGVLVMVAAIALRIADMWINRRPGMVAISDREVSLIVRLQELERSNAQANAIIEEYRARITMLEGQVEFLLEQLAESRAALRTLQTDPPVIEALPASPASPVLVVIDDDTAIDLTAFRSVRTRTGLDFTRLHPADFDKFSNYLARSRQIGKPVRRVHLGLHANENQVQFERPVSALELSAVLNDVECLMLDSCSSERIGDMLGVVPFVVTLREDIANDDAARVAETFWMSVGEGKTYGEAFDAARSLLPNDTREMLVLHHWAPPLI